MVNMQTRGVSISFVVTSQNHKYDDFNEKIYRTRIILVHIWRIRPPEIPEPASYWVPAIRLVRMGASTGGDLCPPQKRHEFQGMAFC